MSEDEIERTLAFLATMLRRYADDTMRGDFAILDAIAEQRHEYARQHPPEVKLRLPASTPPEQVQRALDNQRQTNAKLRVTVGFYDASARPKRKGKKTDTSTVADSPSVEES